MDQDDYSEDPVVQEIDVRLSQSLSSRLFLIQYPLRPSRTPYPADSVLSSQVRSDGGGVRLELKVRPRGDNYSSSKGMYYARMVNLGTGEEGGSDLWDRVTLSSESKSPKNISNGCYAAAVVQDGSLHLTPLQGILQLRPSLSYLDKADIGIKKSESEVSCGGMNSGGDTTESEGEEAAKPVMVRFSKPEGAAKAHKKVGYRKLFTEVRKSSRLDNSWSRAAFFGMDSEEAEDERRLLLAEGEDQCGSFNLSNSQYLDMMFPHVNGKHEEKNGSNGSPSGVVSLEKIKKLPLEKQVLAVLLNAHLVHFKQLCSMLATSASQRAAVLEALIKHAVLVQGCWVVGSGVLYKEDAEAAKRSARDYILYCFHQKRVVPRKDIVGVVRLSNEEVRQLMQDLAKQHFVPQQAWEFKLDSDVEFTSKNGPVVAKENDKWTKRYKELQLEINLQSPAKPTADASTSTSAGTARGTAADGGHPPRQRKKSDPSSSNSSKGKAAPAAISTLPQAADTPQRSGGSVELPPQVIVKKEIEEEVMEEVKEVDLSFLVGLCREAVGRGVVGMKDVKDVLLMRQLEAGPDSSPGVPQEGVTDAVLERALGMCGAVEVGQMYGKRLFARPLEDLSRAAILDLFQKHKKIRKSQVVEFLENESQPVHTKEVVNALKELCYGKSGYWFLRGT